MEEHDPSQPLIVTHTGVDGVCPHWRNLDDSQIRAVADSGGTIGIIFEPHFLRTRGAPNDGSVVIDHMQHIIDVVGEDFVSIGSDYDGAITPPRELGSASGYPRLVQHMLNRGWSVERIAKALGGNFLRVFGQLRQHIRHAVGIVDQHGADVQLHVEVSGGLRQRGDVLVPAGLRIEGCSRPAHPIAVCAWPEEEGADARLPS